MTSQQKTPNSNQILYQSIPDEFPNL